MGNGPPSIDIQRSPCFVVSTGRSGSKMIARTLDVHPDLSALHEPRPHLNTEAYLRWSGRHDSGQVHSRLSAARDQTLAETDQNGLLYVESSHFLSHLIPELHDRYGARFVHLYRDGRDFTRSGLNRWWYTRRRFRQPFFTVLRRLTGLPVGDTFVDHRLDPPSGLEGRFEKIVWLWREKNADILRGLRDVPGHFQMELPLESFSEATISKILDFLGVQATPSIIESMVEVARQKPNETTDYDVPAPDDWPDERKERFWEIAGDMMNHLRYRRGG